MTALRGRRRRRGGGCRGGTCARRLLSDGPFERRRPVCLCVCGRGGLGEEQLSDTRFDGGFLVIVFLNSDWVFGDFLVMGFYFVE